MADVALLHTTKEIIFTDKISPICLPSEENSPVAGDICINSGWGRLGNLDLFYQKLLKKRCLSKYITKYFIKL